MQPNKSPTTVYVVVEDGLAVTLAAVEELSEEDGLHKYVFAPEALSIALCPMQTVSSGETETAGSGFTVTVTCDVAVHPNISPMTV